MPPPGSFRHPWSRRKSFPASGRGREARGHGPPKPFSLSVINTIIALLTPSSHATAPTGCAIAHLPCPTPAQLSIPTRGSAARLAPLRKLPAVILAVAVCPVQAVNRPAYQRQFISIPSTPNPIVSPHSAAAPLKWPVSILVSSCFAVSLHAEVWLLHPLKHRVRDRSPGHLIPVLSVSLPIFDINFI